MRKKLLMPAALFALTFLSTLAAGAMQRGVNPLTDPQRLIEGFPFAGTLMVILLSHELGHFFASRAHHTEATLPYFIPAPSIFGTFGAFIKMRSPIMNRRALVDIGASGPIVGFVFSIAASYVGLMHSEIIKTPTEGYGLELGESLLFRLLASVTIGYPPEGYDIMLHPMAFAGWIGFFVTSLNLIPIGQLDGGHVVYALMGARHELMSKVLVAALAALGLVFWQGWLLWAVLMVVLGLRHPPVVYWEDRLDPRRKAVALAALVIFVLTFMPTPMEVGLEP